MSTPSATPTVDGLTLEDATKKWEDFKSARNKLMPLLDPDFINKFLIKNVLFGGILLSCIILMIYQSGAIRAVAFMLMLCMGGLIGADAMRYVKEKELKQKFKEISDFRSTYPSVVPEGVTDIYSPF